MNADDGGEGGIDISPLIDCVFILLIFFIVTTTFVKETGIEVDKPSVSKQDSLEKTSILIAISAKGEVVYGGKDIGVSGVYQTVKLELEKEKVPVIVQADQAGQVGLFARVMDEAKRAGAEKVSLATKASQK
jgi:biopolymer transport protein ExbD